MFIIHSFEGLVCISLLTQSRIFMLQRNTYRVSIELGPGPGSLAMHRLLEVPEDREASPQRFSVLHIHILYVSMVTHHLEMTVRLRVLTKSK